METLRILERDANLASCATGCSQQSQLPEEACHLPINVRSPESETSCSVKNRKVNLLCVQFSSSLQRHAPIAIQGLLVVVPWRRRCGLEAYDSYEWSNIRKTGSTIRMSGVAELRGPQQEQTTMSPWALLATSWSPRQPSAPVCIGCANR